MLREYSSTLVGQWITTSCISWKWSFDLKRTQMQTRFATRLIDDRHQDLSSPSLSELSPRVGKSSWQLRCWAQNPNVGVRPSQHVKQFGWRKYWRIWTFPSRIQFAYTVTTSTLFIWIGTWCSTRTRSISKCTITSFGSVFKPEMSTFNTSTQIFKRPTSSRKP